MKKLKVRGHSISLALIGCLLISEICVATLAYVAWDKWILTRDILGDNHEYLDIDKRTSIERRIVGIRANCPQNGIAESITVRLLLEREDYESTDPFMVMCALYMDQGGSIIKLAQTETRELWEEVDPVPIWYTFNFQSPKLYLENRTYYVFALAQLVQGFIYVHFDGSEGALVQDVDHFLFPDVFSNPSSYNNSISIYCTYAVAGPAVTAQMFAFVGIFMAVPLLTVILYKKTNRVAISFHIYHRGKSNSVNAAQTSYKAQAYEKRDTRSFNGLRSLY